MAGKSIDNAFAAIIKDCQTIAVEAVKDAAKKTQNDVIKEANSCLQKYYSNYTPEMYKRTYRLKRAIIPYWADKTNKNGVSIEVGVQYKSSALKGAYRSNSAWHQSGNTWKSVIKPVDFSSNNGIPEPDWILENFLDGEHGGAQQDSESTNSLMREFFETKLPNHIEQYINNALFDAFVNRL
jgi:hypothetical protein